MADERLDYTNIDQPYNSLMEKINGDMTAIKNGTGILGQSYFNIGTSVGNISDASQLSVDNELDQITSPSQIRGGTVSNGSFNNIWLTNWMKSTNYQAKARGFYIDGTRGYIECVNIYAKGGIIVGSIDIPDTTSANSFHTTSGGNSWWGASLAAGYAAAPAYILSTGVARFEDVFIGAVGRTGDALAGAINSTSQLVGDIYNGKLDTSSAVPQILMGFEFNSTNWAGAVKTGNLVWNASTGAYISGSGVAIYKGGILGAKQGIGVTFTITTAGDATFVGTVTASAGAIGGWLIGATQLSASTGEVGMSSAGSGATDIRFWAGGLNPAASPFRVQANGIVYCSNISVAGSSTYTGQTISDAYIGNLTCAKITSGTFTVGGTNQPSAITILASTMGNAKLTFENGSRIWEDSSARIGINSIGSPMYVYVNSTERIVIPSSGQTTIRDGVYSDGNFNVSYAVDHAARFAGIEVFFGQTGYDNMKIWATLDDMRYYTTANHEFYQGTTIKAIIDSNIWTAGDLMAAGSKPFVIDHPTDPTKLLKYYSHEGNEVLLRVRGRIKLVNGEAVVDLPVTWTLVTEVGTNQVIATSNEECEGVYAVVLNDTSIKLKELHSGGSNAEVSWECTAVRKGYLNAKNIEDKI